jgi:hydroxylamine reductase (hybrid-cluster protein)
LEDILYEKSSSTTAKNQGCTVKGVCGKPEETADLQDLLIYVCKGISVYGEKLKEMDTVDRNAARFICKALFTTVTNVAWDDDVLIDRIKEGLMVRDEVKKKLGGALSGAPRTVPAGPQRTRKRSWLRPCRMRFALLPPTMRMYAP